MTDPTPAMHIALWTVTGLLVAAFLGCCWEMGRGWRERRFWRFRPQTFRYHRWHVERLRDGVLWYDCKRCGAVAVRGEP